MSTLTAPCQSGLSGQISNRSLARSARSTRCVRVTASSQQQAVFSVKKAASVLLAAAAAVQLGVAGPALAAIGGSGTPTAPKPDSGRETADLYNESSGGPSTGKAYEKRSTLGGQSTAGPSNTGGKPSPESVNK